MMMMRRIVPRPQYMVHPVLSFTASSVPLFYPFIELPMHETEPFHFFTRPNR